MPHTTTSDPGPDSDGGGSDGEPDAPARDLDDQEADVLAFAY